MHAHDPRARAPTRGPCRVPYACGMSSPRDPFLLPGDKPPVGEKLQKFISGAGVTSRRHAEVMIKQGRVTVNGKLATLDRKSVV